MKKIFLFAATALFSMGICAQSNYKMRVLKTDGSEVFYKTSEVEKVDFVEDDNQQGGQQQEEQTLKVFLSGDNPNYDGQCQVTTIKNVGPNGACWLNYPSQMSNDPNVKHGVIIWGPGGGEKPGNYPNMIKRLVSHGFVVLELKESPGDGLSAIAAINWLEEKNNAADGPMSGKLIMDRIGCAGHSMGGLESEQAWLKDKRVYTACLNNSGDLGHTAMSQMREGKSIAIVYGEAGMERPNAEADYNNNGVSCPACLVMLTGGPNTGEGGYGHGSGPWTGMAATCAWMRWHIGREAQRKDAFTTPSGEFVSGNIVGAQGKWSGKWKNWENWVEK